jgi:glycosyltransferase involved in cell wall biosynthesis
LRAASPFDPIVNGLLLFGRRKELYFSPGFNAPLLVRRKLVFVIHDLIHVEFAGESTMMRRLYYRLFVRPAIRHGFRVLTDSEFSKNRIVEWAGVDERKVKVVGCGVDASFAPSGASWQPGFRYILYVGNKKPHKNLVRALQAFKGVAERHTCRFVLCGDPTPDLSNEIQRLHIEDRVIFLGEIQDSLLPSYYRGAELFVFPSMYEGFGLPPLEAMACGTPVVASNVTSLPEVVGDAAILVDPHDVDSIEAGIERGLSDPVLREQLRRMGLERARRYTWDACSTIVNEVLLEAASG